MTFGSLFAGIGGLDLGLERAGMTCKWQVEIDEYARRVLEKHWPNVRKWDDITTFRPSGAQWSVDLICGGFPCQDISTAGKRAGLHGDRSGLFFEAIRVVELLRPRWLLLENVAGLLNRGLDEVLSTLASIGFDAEWHCLQAADFGAPHIRDRVFILAHAQGSRISREPRNICETERRPLGELPPVFEQSSEVRKQDATGADVEPAGEIPNADELRMEGRRNVKKSDRERGQKEKLVGSCLQKPRIFPNAPRTEREPGPRRGRIRQSDTSDLAQWWATEPELGRVANGIPARVDRLRGIGNAVVPQIAEWLGLQIMEADNETSEQ